MQNPQKRIDLTYGILILSVAAVLAYGYYFRVLKPNFEPRLELHDQIIEGTAPSPYRYRILVPFAAEVFTHAASVVLPIERCFLLTYAVYDLLAIFFLLAILFYWLRAWFDREQALIGVLFVAGTMTMALKDHYFQPWSLLEAGLFSAALLAIYRKRYKLLVFILVLATLNRETAVFIPMALFLTIDLGVLLKSRSADKWNPLLLCGGLFLIWAAIFLGLRFVFPNATHVVAIEGLLAWNTSSVTYAFVNASLLLGGLWIFAFLGFRYAPRFIRQIALLIPLYVVTILVWGVWHEVRLLMPLYPILVPLGLSFLYLREQRTITV